VTEGKRKLSKADRTRYVIGAVFFPAGAISLFISPLPPLLAVQCVIIGVVSGALCYSDDDILELVGAVVFGIGILYVGENAGDAVPSWQPPLVTGSALLFAYFVPFVFRKATRR
jgi:hypothetical protein